MPSITTWTRLEPILRSASLADALQGRLYDPAWLLARQWQLGEFDGSDGGSPVSSVLRGDVAPLTRYRPGTTSAPAQRYDVADMPLEALVERERAGLAGVPAGAAEAIATAAEAGQHFLRLLAREAFGTRYHQAFAGAFPLPVAADADSPDLRFLVVMARRVPDGRAVARALRDDALPANLAIDGGDRPALDRVRDRFLAWFDRFILEPAAADAGAWSDERLEYACAVAAPARPGPGAPAEVVLQAREYYGGTLDWHHFDLTPGVALGAADDSGQTRSFTSRTVPAPVTYRGMPAARWWEFEDAAVDFGRVDAEPDDLARMLLVEFAVTFGNDWFVVPLDLDVGSVCRITSLVVADTFGVRTLVPGIGGSTHPTAGSWRMFCHTVVAPAAPASPAGADPGLLYLAPRLARSIDGPVLDDVYLLRDETANLVWGVERVAEGPSGRGVDQDEAARARDEAASIRTEADEEPGTDDLLVWQLATPVPDNWIPLVPVRAGTPDGAIRFRRGAMLRQDGSNAPRPARSRILAPTPGARLDLFEEEVPREGVRIVRAFQFARWLGGQPLLWAGRRKSVGRGEGSSGLQFDRAVPRS
jgi:hypothetical protein